MESLLNRLGMWNKSGMVIEYFLTHPTASVHVRLLARLVGISAPWVSSAVKQAAKQGILLIRKDKQRKETIIEANRDNTAYLALKRWHNLYSIHASGLQDYLIQSYGRPECIVLFGSYSKGEDIEQSDIDIAVITKRKPAINLVLYEKKLGRTITVKTLSKDHIEKEFWNTLANGIVLYGYLEVPV